eukprot:gnl/MRDRNA2_/MRDRNA2_235367_c0_seq1.p1 gnl/MRDRNA2_/MRDRNA2_235367_c0~~gnl/MRDRNA2_/MRDRNA2_235367_c0_seq1.p1  ORF type:complete len:394 (-),score=44.89 gnl/MRDRNA2_/MRDRNA2_235367_c0_seq1:63-1202(-)
MLHLGFVVILPTRGANAKVMFHLGFMVILPTSGANWCGGAVNTNFHNENSLCEEHLWIPTGDRTLQCYAYGGLSDPCSLNNQNDVNDGLDKDPSFCNIGDTFFLWDEPDTQRKSYVWAGAIWKEYSEVWSTQITTMRNGGMRFTTPLVKADQLIKNLDEFFNACGNACLTRSNAAFIDIIAINPFCGTWNFEGSPQVPIDPSDASLDWKSGCSTGAAWILEQLNMLSNTKYANLKVHLVNWGVLGAKEAADQLGAIFTTAEYFARGSPVERVYYFGATDYGGGTTNNFLSNILSEAAINARIDSWSSYKSHWNWTRYYGKTLGFVWGDYCNKSIDELLAAEKKAEEEKVEVVIDASHLCDGRLCGLCAVIIVAVISLHQ